MGVCFIRLAQISQSRTRSVTLCDCENRREGLEYTPLYPLIPPYTFSTHHSEPPFLFGRFRTVCPQQFGP